MKLVIQKDRNVEREPNPPLPPGRSLIPHRKSGEPTEVELLGPSAHKPGHVRVRVQGPRRAYVRVVLATAVRPLR